MLAAYEVRYLPCSAVSSNGVSEKPTDKATNGTFDSLAASAVVVLESIPPLKKAATDIAP